MTSIHAAFRTAIVGLQKLKIGWLPPLFLNRAGDFPAHGSPSCPPFARGKQPNLREVASSVARNFISNIGSVATTIRP